MNPLGFNYSMDTSAVPGFAKPSAIIVTGRGNRYDPAFQEARKRGAKVYTYWNVANVPDNLSNAEDAAQYLIGGKPPPRWPYKDKNGKDRTQWPGTYLLDLRPGSAWLKHIIPTTGDVVDKGKFDGFFLDTLGARTWSSSKVVNGVTVPGADWETWSVDEQTAWAEGSVNILRALKEEINRRNPAIELVCNNIWQLQKTHPAYDIAAQGDQHCNGVCLENPAGDTPSEFHKNYAGRPFGRQPRRVFVIDRTDADTILWSKVAGVTHVCSVEKSTGETYMRITPPVVPYVDEGTKPPPTETCEVKLAAANAKIASLTTQLDEQTKKNSDLQSRMTQISSHSAEITKLASG